MATQRGTAIWVDVNGFTTAQMYTTSAGDAAVLTALLAKSHADVLSTWEGALSVNPSPVPTTGDYQTVGDKANLLFSTGAGTLVTVVLPAPKSSIFLADQETVDFTQIAAIIAAVIAGVVDGSGNAVTTFIGGTRTVR
jgi:hypothetical protein